MAAAPRNYIVDRSPPGEFGDQEDYNRRVEAFVAEWTGRLVEAKAQRVDIKEFFLKQLFPAAGAWRREVATAHRTEEMENFGTRRDDERLLKAHGSWGAYTPPDNPKYLDYTLKFKRVIQAIVQHCKETGQGTLQGGVHRIQETTYLGRKGAFDIRRYDAKELKELQWHKNPLTVLSQEENRRIAAIFRKATSRAEALNKCKKEVPNYYTHDKFFGVFDRFFNRLIEAGVLGPFDSLWLTHATVRLEINGQLFALTQYVMLEGSKGSTTPIFMHQDALLLQQTLLGIASIFETCALLERDKTEWSTLRDHVGFYVFLYGHAMPFLRGTSSTGDVIERILYRTQLPECQFSSDPTKQVNLTALTPQLTHESFLREEGDHNYKGTFTLTPDPSSFCAAPATSLERR